IYAEPVLKQAIAEDYYLNIQTMAVSRERPAAGPWEQFSTLKNVGQLDKYKQKIFQKWSAKDYNYVDYPSDKLFFESFDKFWPVAEGHIAEGLLELKNRAIKENLSYLETQLSPVVFDMKTNDLNIYNGKLHQLEEMHNEKEVMLVLDTLYNQFIQRGAKGHADKFNAEFISRMHDSLKIDDDHFTIRFQNYVLRFMDPVDLFKNLVVNFISADGSPYIAGVNIVSPEDGEVSMRDYWLHMLMFKYCHSRFPNVKYSLHAGELTLGLVPPEELTWHIRSAVYTAGANRIGHGVDLPYEEKCYDLLRYMSSNKIPVEINLSSNEFILKVKDDRHPITLYKQFGVPIIICSDDAGILRTSLTEQYVLLAKRYKDITYSDIKQFVYNGIIYSFIKDESVKKQLLSDLDNRFKDFEKSLPIN
ncbi:MAG: adenosine deaminase, partial [Bacteroidota bacterium]|nr:adenosine deaminase [Bacteroidota bacterium]